MAYCAPLCHETGPKGAATISRDTLDQAIRALERLKADFAGVEEAGGAIADPEHQRAYDRANNAVLEAHDATYALLMKLTEMLVAVPEEKHAGKPGFDAYSSVPDDVTTVSSYRARAKTSVGAVIRYESEDSFGRALVIGAGDAGKVLVRSLQVLDTYGQPIEPGLEAQVAIDEITGVAQVPAEAVFPRDVREAAERIMPVVKAIDEARLSGVDPLQFKRAWYAIGFLHEQIDPDMVMNAEGSVLQQKADVPPVVLEYDTRIAGPIYGRTGWPVLLAEVAEDAKRRVQKGELTETERVSNFRLSQASGLEYRSPEERQSAGIGI